MAELTLEQILTSIKKRQPLPPEIRQDIIEGASKVGSFLWKGTGPGIAMDVAKMRMENPGLPLSDIFPAVVGAGILRGKGKFRPRVIKGGFSELDDAAKFKATVKRQARKEENLEDIFGARKEKSEAHEILENAREIHKASKARLDKIFDESYKKQRSRLKEGISGLPKKEQDRILKAVDEGRIGEISAEYGVGVKQTPRARAVVEKAVKDADGDIVKATKAVTKKLGDEFDATLKTHRIQTNKDFALPTLLENTTIKGGNKLLKLFNKLNDSGKFNIITGQRNFLTNRMGEVRITDLKNNTVSSITDTGQGFKVVSANRVSSHKTLEKAFKRLTKDMLK